MNAPPNLYATDVEAAPAPTVFVRTLAAPPGAPWDQLRAARLEARVGAPLPLTDIVYRLHRLEPWRLGHAARYAVCYVRIDEIGEDYTADVTVDGRSIAVRFLSLAVRRRQAQRIAMVAGVLICAAVMTITGLMSALSVRADLAERLDTTRHVTALRLRQGEAKDRLRTDERMLRLAGVQNHDLGAVLGQVVWASTAKSPAAHIDALHWERGYLAVEVRGENPPFTSTDRLVVKSAKPIRPDVWLWGVGPVGQDASKVSVKP